MRILDRYILKNFLLPFIYCFVGFIAIWLLIDLTSNMGEFTDSRTPMRAVAFFYATQVPQIIVLVLPMTLLLALLYSLSRMSRSNEIISMLTAGQSLARLTLPLLLVGIVASAFSFAMNYQLAAHSDMAKKEIFDRIRRRDKEETITTTQLFRNRADNRTWFVKIKLGAYSQPELLHADLKEFEAVHITQQTDKGDILRIYYGAHAKFGPKNHEWTFSEGKTVDFDLEGNITREENWPELKITSWSETPWRILCSNLDSQNLSVPELLHYLDTNKDFPPSQLAPFLTYYYYRLAYPAECIVVILIATPLGIVYSRRGVMAGVASSIFIFFGLMFFDKLFLALGKHGSIPAPIAAWGTNTIFAVAGLLLLYMRSTNRDLFKWNVRRSFRLTKPA